MKKRLNVFLLLGILVLLIHPASAHETEQAYSSGSFGIYPISQMQAFAYGSLAFLAVVGVILLFHKKMKEPAKKLFYYILALICAVVTLYLALTTIHLNLISHTKGPVRWHADYEVWVCGKELKLAMPAGMSGKQGTALVHSHYDNRIHVEGVLLDIKQASLDTFFDAIGGSLSSGSMQFPTDDGLVIVSNGEKCDSGAGLLYVFVNGFLVSNPQDYTISPYEKIPPGDKIKIIFTDQPIEEINQNIK